jgi:putative ABC transport system permease protein
MNAVQGQRMRVFALAAAHLRHEWVLTLCLVSALAAVLAPLLILMGLKEGTIETLRERLVQDPVFREIRPALTRTFDQPWLDALAADSGVAFLTPTILPASSVIHLDGADRQSELTDLLPSAAGDPLLLENGGVIPGEGEVVLSVEAARRLGVAVGDAVTARVTRSRGGRMESVTPQLRVAAVLSPRAGSLARAYTGLDFVVDVEAYKEGRGVPRRGWPGQSARPHMSFTGALVLTQRQLDAVTRTGLAVNTGLLRSEPLSAGDFAELTGLPLPSGWNAYRLAVPQGSVTRSSIDALKRKLRGHDALVLPHVAGATLVVDGRETKVMGLSLSARQASRLGWPELPWGKFSERELDADRLFQIASPELAERRVEALFHGAAELAFPLRVAVVEDANGALIPAELLGMLNTARERQVVHDPAEGGLVLLRAGFRGFRLFARTIDDVPRLVDRMRADGITVIAEVEAIRRIQVLDRGLSQLFWLIAVLGVVGAGAVLVASLYAAVERERKDLGILRLIGLSRTDVFWFPVFQGALIALLGVALGWFGYAVLAGVINRVFADELVGGEAICRLPAATVGMAFAVTLALAIVSSLVAAWKATLIEPAEAIREE